MGSAPSRFGSGIVIVAGTAIVVGLAGVASMLSSTEPSVDVAAVRAVDLAAGEAIYAAHCAACHGLDLEGAPDWRSPAPDGRYPAPPHDESGHTWHHDDATLFDYTRLGGDAAMAARGLSGANSGMPGFADVLTDAEIRDVLAWIASTWPDRVRAARAARSGS